MVELLNIDCMEYMAGLPDKSFDLAIVDPPYNVGRKYSLHDDSMSSNAYNTWCYSWFKEIERVSDTIVMTIGYKNLKFWMNLDPRHMIIWSKPNQNSPSPLGGFNAYEPVLFWGKLHKRIGHDLFVTNIKMQPDAAFHNCPKDLQSWKKLLQMCIAPPAKIFDPFFGSGTSALSCHYLGFDFVGCELDKDYYNAACKRFKEQTAQQQLFK
jgi:site-specific DNA-methyltransferase (adenine-specific)